MINDFVDLFTLQKDLKEGLTDLFPDRIWVKAEIASLNVKSNGHCYLDLVQSERGSVIAKVRGIIWRSYYPLLNAKFKASAKSDISTGTEVLVRVQVNFHEVFGLSLVIDDIDAAFTIGEQQLKRQQTIERLTKEGLMERQKGLRLSDLPYYLAVISAEGAAGLGDFRHHLLGNEYGFAYRLDFFPATMQGEGAPEAIQAVLAEVQEAGVRYDAVLLLRGGGSDMDLVCFDDYDLAATIARFPVPVITAIGHDKDFHVADMVAYDHVKTPTALADMFINLTAAADERIDSFENRLAIAFQNRLNMAAARLDMLSQRVGGNAIRRLEGAEGRMNMLKQRIAGGAVRRVDSSESGLDLLEKGIVADIRAMVSFAESRVILLEQRIASTDPRNVLKRGFSLALDSGGVKLTSAYAASPGDRIAVQFADGRILADVKEINSTK